MAITITWIGEAEVGCDGSFKHVATVRNTSGTPINASIGVSSVGDAIIGVASRPGTIENLSSAPRTVTVTGKLRSACTEGVIALNVAGQLEGGTVRASRVSAKLNGAAPTANADGDFSYTLAVMCCDAPGGGAVTWELLHQSSDSDNVESSAPAPLTVTCPPVGPHMVFVTGKLDEPSIEGEDVYGLSTDNALVCKVATKIAPFVPEKDDKKRRGK